MTYILITIALLAGSLVTWFVMRNQSTNILKNINETNESRISELKSQYEGRIEELKEQHDRQTAELKEQHERQTTELKEQHERQTTELKEQHSEQIFNLRKLQDEQLQQQLQLVREQMNTASERILKERAEQLSSTNREQLAVILNPLQNNIQQMREAVEKSGKDNMTTMERLDATIKQSIEQSREVGERADKLAQALTGENKTQGNFGELRLKQMLEEMGLEEGVQFVEQATMRDASGNIIYDEEDGRKMIPDVILHFPDNRDIIIDSKMSFTAFERYHNSDNEEEKRLALQQHILSMRNHVNELAKKNYSKYIQEGHGKLDFVLMYVFSESALQLALSNDATLWKEAYDKGVIISGSQNLYVLLRVLEMTWKQVRQVENQQKIMDCADTIINRVQIFVERFDNARQQLSKTQQAFDSLDLITADKGTSIVTSARQLIKMGAKENTKRKKLLTNIKELPEEE